MEIRQALLLLQAQGLERLDAQLLLLHVLGRAPTQRGWLLAHDTDLLNADQVAALHTLALRCANHEPLAYLIGRRDFFGLELQVDSRVLVPRADTETLVNWALEVLHKAPPSASVLDLGTGSGAIALAIKACLPTLQVHATDLSADALLVARANAQRLQLDVHFSQGAWFAGLPDASGKFDCIISNPPYIADADPHLAALVHEPLQALTGGADGLDGIRHIVHTAPEHLTTGSWLLLEHGYDQSGSVRDLLTARGFSHVQSRYDLAGVQRCSSGQWLHQE